MSEERGPKRHEKLAYAKVIARAWNDEAFKKQLLADPRAVLAAEGIFPSSGVTIKVVENTPTVMHLVLPIKPSEQEVSVRTLEKMSGTSGPLGYCGFCVHLCDVAGSIR